MSETARLRGRPVTNEEAMDAAMRFINEHFKNGSARPDTRIPAQVTDSDIVLMDYLLDSAALTQRLAESERERDEARAKCEMALSRNQDLIDERDRAFDAGIRAVLTIRCSKHVGVPQICATEFSGGECGACVQEAAAPSAGRERELREALAALRGWIDFVDLVGTRGPASAKEQKRRDQEEADFEADVARADALLDAAPAPAQTQDSGLAEELKGIRAVMKEHEECECEDDDALWFHLEPHIRALEALVRQAETP